VFKGVIPPRPWGVLAVANAGRCTSTTGSGNSHTPGGLRLPAENSRVVLGLIFPAPPSGIFKAPLSSFQAARCISNKYIVGNATPRLCQTTGSHDLSRCEERHTT